MPEETTVTVSETTTPSETVTEPEEIEEDENQWLKDELTGLRTEFRNVAETLRATLEAQETARNNSTAEMLTMNNSLKDMLTEANRNLTTLATALVVSGTSRLTPSNSESTSANNPTEETVTVIEPVESAVTQDRNAEPAREERKRRKL